MQARVIISVEKKNHFCIWKHTFETPGLWLTMLILMISVSFAIRDFLSVQFPFFSSPPGQPPLESDNPPIRTTGPTVTVKVRLVSLKASANNRPSSLGGYQRYLPLGSATCACVREKDLAKEQAPLCTSVCEYVCVILILCSLIWLLQIEDIMEIISVRDCMCVSECICPSLAQNFCTIFTHHLHTT